jgi:hypothetical protein
MNNRFCNSLASGRLSDRVLRGGACRWSERGERRDIGKRSIANFQAVLSDLSDMLGGAYRPRATFSTSANELFQKLDHSEQELL